MLGTPALTKRSGALGIFMQPRPDEFGPFLRELAGLCSTSEFCCIALRNQKRHGNRKLAGIVVHSLVGFPFFRPFVLYEEEGRRTPMADPLGMLCRPTVFFATVLFRVQRSATSAAVS